MSMDMLTIMQLLAISAAYGLLTLVLPAVVFYKKVASYRGETRVLFYFLVGNFFVMNLVFILQLLHISNAFTLWLATSAAFVFVGSRCNAISVKETSVAVVETFYRLAVGQMGIKQFWYQIFQQLFVWMKRFSRHIWGILKKSPVEKIIFLGLFGFMVWYNTYNAFQNYGYGASDIPVHNYWINAMGENQIFVAGIYPFGFHCIIYYLHTVFGLDTFVLLRLFGDVQTCFIFLILYIFMRGMGRTKYAALSGFGIYLLANIFIPETFYRYLCALPQEFGMLFILPTVYFIMEFFRIRKAEVESTWKSWPVKRVKDIPSKTADWHLVMAVLSFSMSLAVHFYDTMIVGLFCIAIALGYLYQVFQKGYLKRLIAAGILGLSIAIAPMGIAYMLGTPLQGSLGWGMSVINNTATTNTQESVDTQEGIDVQDSVDTQEGIDVQESVDVQVILLDDYLAQQFQNIQDKLRAVAYIIADQFRAYVLQYEKDASLYLLLAGMGILLLGSGIYAVAGQWEAAKRCLAFFWYMIFITLLLVANLLRLPQLMDANRSRIFLIYSIPILIAFDVDIVVYLLTFWTKKKWFIRMVSMAVSISVCVGAVGFYSLRLPKSISTYETNGAITCVTNIVNSNKQDTFTIVSAGDELQMISDFGYHYEVIDFLHGIEDSTHGGEIVIPTKRVYFFIEKIPVGENATGVSISAEAADNPVPFGNSSLLYQGEYRVILMSRMYFWALQFQKLYPNEMKVYYEDDDFICYCIEQNEYSLYNFVIDYGYNNQ